MGDVITTGPIAQRVAENGERPGGRRAAPDAQVWAVLLSGAFPYGSCSFILFATSAARGTPCPAPAALERVLVDARDGSLIEVIVGG